MKAFHQGTQTSRNLAVIVARSLLVAGFLVLLTGAWAQTAAVLAIAPSGTNGISITITNNIGTNDYDLQWTPVLDNTNFPWTYAAIGVPGGTNFLLNTNGYPATFFRAVLDSSAVPLWEQANPANTNSPILTVTIASPANGANLNQ